MQRYVLIAKQNGQELLYEYFDSTSIVCSFHDRMNKPTTEQLSTTLDYVEVRKRRIKFLF